MDDRTLGRLFSPFFTEFDPKHHSSGEFGFGKRGLGLGLYLVRSFIELHGGEVAARSAPDRGTEITLRLPRHPRPPAGTRVQSESGAALAASGSDDDAIQPAGP